MPSDLVQAAVDHYHELLWTGHLASTEDGVRDAYSRAPKLLLRPYITTRSEYRRHAAVLRVVACALRTAVERLLANRALRRQIGIPAYLDEVIDLEPPDVDLSAFARFDAMVSGDGEVHPIEYNSEPGVIHRIARIMHAFGALPIARAFEQRYPFDFVVPTDLAMDAQLADFRKQGRPGPGRFVIVNTTRRRPAGATSGHGNPLEDFGGAEIADPGDFEYRDDRLFLGGRPVDVVVLQDWTDLLTGADTGKALGQAIRRAQVRVLNSVSKGLLGSYKHVFELLSDPEHARMFTPDTAAVLERCVPWTRVVRDRRTTYRDEVIDLIPFVSAHRERFVLKPGGGFSGGGVRVGWDCDQASWDTVLAKRSQTYVVQERVQGERQGYAMSADAEARIVELKSDYCPYILNGDRIEGCFMRVSTDDVLNLARGSTLAAVWILRDD
jgi:hypothetical protein